MRTAYMYNMATFENWTFYWNIYYYTCMTIMTWYLQYKTDFSDIETWHIYHVIMMKISTFVWGKIAVFGFENVEIKYLNQTPTPPHPKIVNVYTYFRRILCRTVRYIFGLNVVFIWKKRQNSIYSHLQTSFHCLEFNQIQLWISCRFLILL